MYTKETASALRSEFWTVFGKYMAPIPSVEGENINWINYKTGIKHIQFKMEADHKKATIGIYLSHPEIVQRLRFYDRLVLLKKMLHMQTGEQWIWRDLDYLETDKPYSSVSLTIGAVNVYDKNSWPMIISFFKQRMILLDQWWNEVKFSFEAMDE